MAARAPAARYPPVRGPLRDSRDTRNPILSQQGRKSGPFPSFPRFLETECRAGPRTPRSDAGLLAALFCRGLGPPISAPNAAPTSPTTAMPFPYTLPPHRRPVIADEGDDVGVELRAHHAIAQCRCMNATRLDVGDTRLSTAQDSRPRGRRSMSCCRRQSERLPR